MKSVLFAQDYRNESNRTEPLAPDAGTLATLIPLGNWLEDMIDKPEKNNL